MVSANLWYSFDNNKDEAINDTVITDMSHVPIYEVSKAA